VGMCIKWKNKLILRAALTIVFREKKDISLANVSLISTRKLSVARDPSHFYIPVSSKPIGMNTYTLNKYVLLLLLYRCKELLVQPCFHRAEKV